MTKKAKREKTPTPVSNAVVDAMEARLTDAQDHNAAPAAPASSAHASDSADASPTPQDGTHT